MMYQQSDPDIAPGDGSDATAPPGEEIRLRETRTTVERTRLYAITRRIRDLLNMEMER